MELNISNEKLPLKSTYLEFLSAFADIKNPEVLKRQLAEVNVRLNAQRLNLSLNFSKTAEQQLDAIFIFSCRSYCAVELAGFELFTKLFGGLQNCFKVICTSATFKLTICVEQSLKTFFQHTIE